MATDMSNSQQQQRGLVRASGSPLGMMLVPGDLFRMTPFSLMRRMTEEMDRVFGEFGLSHGETKAVWSPPIEVSQRDGAYVVRAELPGVDSGDVKLEEGMPGKEPSVADAGVDGATAGDQVQARGQAGRDDLARQVDEVAVAPPRPGDHGDDPTGFQ